VYVTCTPSEVIRTISTGVPAGKVGELKVPQVKVTLAGVLGGIAVVLIVVALQVIRTISTGVPAGKVGELEVPQVKVTLAGVLGGIAVVLIVVVLLVVALLVEVVVIVTVVRGVEHIRVPFVNSSSAVAMETVGLPGGL